MKNYKYLLYFIVAIVLFAAIYFLLGFDSFNRKEDEWNFIESLYFSIVTITTLGFGDICPTTGWAKFFVCLEAISGLIIVGVLLNDISSAQAEKVSKAEQKKNEKEIRQKAIRGYKSRYTTISERINAYYHACYTLFTPMSERSEDIPDRFNPETYSFNKLIDMFGPNLALHQDFMKPAVESYYEAQNNLVSDFTIIAMASNEECLEPVVTLINKFRYDCDARNFEGAFKRIQQLFTQDGEKKPMSDIIVEAIRNYKEGEEISSSSIVNSAYQLYLLVKSNIKLLDTLDAESNKLFSELD